MEDNDDYGDDDDEAENVAGDKKIHGSSSEMEEEEETVERQTQRDVNNHVSVQPRKVVRGTPGAPKVAFGFDEKDDDDAAEGVIDF